MAVDAGDEPVKHGAAQQGLEFTAADARRLAKRYKAGATLNALAAEFGCGRTTINRRLRSIGVQARRVSPTDDKVDQMVSQYAEGRSLAAVGAALGFDATSVMKYLSHGALSYSPPRGSMVRVDLDALI